MLAVMLLPPVSASAEGTVSTLLVEPRLLIAGMSATGTVTLQPDPDGLPTTVLLSSSDTAAAVVPASVVADPGVSVVTFPITAIVNAPDSSFVRISATTTAGVAADYLISVNPNAWPLNFSSISVTPSVLVGGQLATGNATIVMILPTDGTSTAHTSMVPDPSYLWLTSSDPSVLQVPEYALIPWGEYSSTFAVTTTAVSAPRTVTITGVWRGTMQRSTTVLVGPPGVRVSLASWKNQRLTVVATDYNAGATLSVGTRILTSRGNGNFDGQFTSPTKPGTITVRDNFGNTTTVPVS